jgi:hypothetical protein
MFDRIESYALNRYLVGQEFAPVEDILLYFWVGVVQISVHHSFPFRCQHRRVLPSILSLDLRQ